MLVTTIQKRVNDLLCQHRMTQSSLAKKIGITQPTLSRNLNGIHAPRAKVLESIAQVFNVSVDYLLGASDCIELSQNKCRLKELREKHKLTVRELADKVNINYATLSRMENGMQNFTDEYLTILADFFAVSIDYLLGYSSNEKSLNFNGAIQIKIDSMDFTIYNEIKDLNYNEKKDILEILTIFKRQRDGRK